MDRKDTCFIRFLAILLITNSHLDSLYPIPQLATGGAIGNALFFMVSGYGLALSERRRERLFFEWYARRIARIYPSLILVIATVNLYLFGGWKTWGVSDYITAFIWPTPAWFVAALMLFYIIFFALLKMKNPSVFMAGIAALTMPYIYFYVTSVNLSAYTIEGPGYFKWIFYLQIMFFGGYLAGSDVPRGYARHLTWLLLCLCIYYGVLFLINLGITGKIQFLAHLMTYPILYFIFMVSRSAFVIEKIMSVASTRLIISFVSGLTLEIYLLQSVVYTNEYIKSLVFPMNILAFWCSVIALSFLVNGAAELIRRSGRVIWLRLRLQVNS